MSSRNKGKGATYIMYIFNDWATVLIPCKHNERHHGGIVSSTDTDNKLEWKKHKRLMLDADGSASARVSVRSVDCLERTGTNEDYEAWSRKWHCIISNPDKTPTKFDCLEISGNPTKWLNKGHNVWGSQDMAAAFFDWVKEVLSVLGIELSLWEYNQLKNGYVMPMRMDITSNMRVDASSDVKRLLNAIQQQADSRYQNRSAVGTTAYFGKDSRVKSIVFYDKHVEFMNQTKKKKFKGKLGNNLGTVLVETQGLIRYELKLKSQWFRTKHFNTLYGFFNYMDNNSLMEDELDKLNLGQLDMSDDEINKKEALLMESLKGQRVRNSVMNSFYYWKQGNVVKDRVQKDTFYKHRKIIEPITGIDIKNQRVIEGKGKVVPLITYVRASFSSPGKEYSDLIYQPASSTLKQG